MYTRAKIGPLINARTNKAQDVNQWIQNRKHACLKSRNWSYIYLLPAMMFRSSRGHDWLKTKQTVQSTNICLQKNNIKSFLLIHQDHLMTMGSVKSIWLHISESSRTHFCKSDLLYSDMIGPKNSTLIILSALHIHFKCKILCLTYFQL